MRVGKKGKHEYDRLIQKGRDLLFQVGEYGCVQGLPGNRGVAPETFDDLFLGHHRPAVLAGGSDEHSGFEMPAFIDLIP